MRKIKPSKLYAILANDSILTLSEKINFKGQAFRIVKQGDKTGIIFPDELLAFYSNEEVDKLINEKEYEPSVNSIGKLILRWESIYLPYEL